MTARAVMRSSPPSAVSMCTVKGLLLPAGVDDPVPAGAGHAADPRSVADPVAEDVGERLEVALGPVTAGRVGRAFGADPAGRGEQLLGRRVGDLGPRREQADVRPVTDGTSGGRAGLQDQGFQAAFDEVCGGGQAGRAGSDDHDGQVLLVHGGGSFGFLGTGGRGGGVGGRSLLR